MHEPDPNGPGLRKTGDCYLAKGDEALCGANVVQIHLMLHEKTGFIQLIRLPAAR